MRRCIVRKTIIGAVPNDVKQKYVEANFHKFFEGGAIVEFDDGHCELVELSCFMFKKYARDEPSYEGPI